MEPSARAVLRARLAQSTPIVVPGCYDVLSALSIQAAGFEAVLVSGFGVSASLLGVPDVELYTGTEMASVCARIGLPVLADADNGYGNALNVMRTVAELERAGVASITLEDQSSPKRCPLIGDSPLVSLDEAAGKIRAAVRERQDPGLMIVARTDARDPDEVLQRARAYVAAGADAIKLISPAVRGHDLLRELKSHCAVPLFISSLGWAATADLRSFDGLAGVITHPLMPLTTAAAALQDNLRALAARAALPHAPMKLDAIESLLGIEQVRRDEAEFLPG